MEELLEERFGTFPPLRQNFVLLLQHLLQGPDLLLQLIVLNNEIRRTFVYFLHGRIKPALLEGDGLRGVYLPAPLEATRLPSWGCSWSSRRPRRRWSSILALLPCAIDWVRLRLIRPCGARLPPFLGGLPSSSWNLTLHSSPPSSRNWRPLAERHSRIWWRRVKGEESSSFFW